MLQRLILLLTAACCSALSLRGVQHQRELEPSSVLCSKEYELCYADDDCNACMNTVTLPGKPHKINDCGALLKWWNSISFPDPVKCNHIYGMPVLTELLYCMFDTWAYDAGIACGTSDEPAFLQLAAVPHPINNDGSSNPIDRKAFTSYTTTTEFSSTTTTEYTTTSYESSTSTESDSDSEELDSAQLNMKEPCDLCDKKPKDLLMDTTYTDSYGLSSYTDESSSTYFTSMDDSFIGPKPCEKKRDDYGDSSNTLYTDSYGLSSYTDESSSTYFSSMDDSFIGPKPCEKKRDGDYGDSSNTLYTSSYGLSSYTDQSSSTYFSSGSTFDDDSLDYHKVDCNKHPSDFYSSSYYLPSSFGSSTTSIESDDVYSATF